MPVYVIDCTIYDDNDDLAPELARDDSGRVMSFVNEPEAEAWAEKNLSDYTIDDTDRIEPPTTE